ncbi:MAG: amino acid ABC transporter permease [Neomegalonema sp.]|nr:amino acid ABC transporter permease [Neomegalonema sp.]
MAETHPETGVDQTSEKGSLIYDPKVRGIFFQILVGGFILWFFYFLAQNTLTNLAAQGKDLSFGFLDQIAGFQMGTTFGTWFMDYTPGVSHYRDVLILGLLNTISVAIIGIILATVIGFTIGIFRLSENAILRGFGTVYVEIFRNIPVLLWIFIFYFGVLRNLPSKREKIEIAGDAAGLNITGLYLPFPDMQPGFWMSALAVLIAIAGWFGIAHWARKRQEDSGQTFPTFWAGLGLLIVLPLIVFYATGAPLNWEYPVFMDSGPILRRGYQIGQGTVIIPEMIALTGALSFYTAAFIAEIVRAGILAINKGQSEAAHALGLRQQPTLNLVIIPQALRVIIPPLTSQYLNLTKNSSLAVAIAYPDLVSSATTALNVNGRAIEIIFIVMLCYLTLSLGTAALMNWFNNRMKLVER